jgi:hypothetical protein
MMLKPALWGTAKGHILQRVLITVLALALPTRASTLVAVWTPETLVLAADGRLTLTDSNGEVLDKSGVACKLRIENGVLYGASGLYEWKATGFSLPDVLNKGLRMAMGVNRRSLPLEDVASRAMSDIAIALKDAKQGVGESIAKNPNFNFGELILAGIDGDSLKVVLSRIDISVSQEGSIFSSGSRVKYILGQSVLPGPEPHKSLMAVAIGQQDAILAYQSSHPDWIKEDPIKLTRMFIGLEIVAQPNSVGPPIALLVLSKDGSTRWLEKGACTE